MSNPQTETYTLICILNGEESPFPIKIANNETVGVLKEAIKEKNPNALANIDARSLVLYQIDVNDDDEMLVNIQKKMSESPKALRTTKELSALYTSAPAKKTVHILVQLPGSVDMRRGVSSGSGSGSGPGPEPDDSIGLKRKNIYSDDMDGPQPKRKGPRHSGEKSIGSLDVNQHLFTDFHHQCWGNPLDPVLKTLPIPATGVGGLELDDEEDTSSVILPGEPYLNIFDTRFLVRAEYIRTFDEVKVVYDDDCKHQPSHQHLAVVTGQPGIGKTTWIYYALRRCVGEKQPVIWYTGGKFLLFSDEGVERFEDPMDSRHPPYTWCFVDSTAADRLPDTIYHRISRLFPVYVTSPKEERWEKLHQLRYPKLVIMNPWTMAELEKAKVLYPDRTSEEISERFGNAGPIARICLHYTPEDISAFYIARDKKLEWDTTQRLLDTLVDDKNGKLRIGDISHQLCVVRRSSSIWKYTVEPISALIRHRILSQIWKWKEKDRIDMIERLSRVPGAAGMRGVLFESQYQHRFSKKIEIVAAPMFRASRPRSRWHAAFGDFSASPKLDEAQKNTISLSISPSELQTYHRGPLAIEENIYYVPFSENEVAIDSFIVHDEHLYLFQFATGSQHGVNRRLVDRLSQFSRLPVAENWRFIFVVPKTLDKFSCPHSDNGFFRDHVPYVAQIDSRP